MQTSWAAAPWTISPKSAGRVVPVGRLDRASEGLLLLTNNGEPTQRLLHPKYRQPRTHLVW
ncbi:MAG: pseudouridine synthase [Candidatus Eisenbacteria bacterium]